MYKEYLVVLDYQFVEEIELICISLSYDYRIISFNNHWLFLISEIHYNDFYKNLNEFINENLLFEPVENEIPFPVLNDKPSFFSYSIISGIIIFYLYYALTDKKYYFFAIGANDAYKVVNGEFYRCITALFLHANIVHLLSNIIFFTVLYRYSVRIIGEGLTWFLIIVSGAIGNFLTSFIYGAFHSSIGFSTSVFATLGILANLNFKIVKNYLPIIGVFFLLIMLGGGDKKVDVVSHITGLLSGYFITEILIKKFQSYISLNKQTLFKILTILIICLCWCSGLIIYNF